MKMRLVCRVVLLGLVVAFATAHATGDAQAAQPAPLAMCGPPDDATGAVGALPHVADAIRDGKHLHVLAVGSATMFGPEPATPAPPTPGFPKPSFPVASAIAFPMQMAKALQAAIPGLQVDVVLRGGRGMTAADMLEQIKSELATGHYQLVLWQTGTVEAVHNSPSGEFAQTLSDGAEAIEEANANLVLIDPQFSRFLQTNSNLDPYIQAMQQTASMQGVLLFHRFDLMRGWANEGRMDLEHTPKPDRKRTVEALHACLGSYLAHLIITGARS